MSRQTKYSGIGVLLALAWGFAGGTWAFAQDISGVAQETIRVNSIRLGPHPEYTRILVNLSGPADYQVSADFVNKQITLTLDNVSPGPGLRSKIYKDKNLDRVDVHSVEGRLSIRLSLKNPNTRFFHFLKSVPPQIVLDLKGLDRPFLKTRIGPGAEEGARQPEKKIKARIKGLTPEQIQQIVQKNEEDQLKHGWEEYQKALRMFQEQKFSEANNLFRKFIRTYPDSKYLSDIIYLHAESIFRIAFREPNPIYERALDAYKRSVRMFPKSKFFDHALYKLAFIYDEMGYNIEARELYERGITRNRKSMYNSARKSGLAAMLMKEERFEEALVAFKSLLKKSPKNLEAKAAIFDIATYYFDQGNFKRSIDIYEEGARRWSSELNERPIINFNMGTIYFTQKNYARGRKHFFDVINLSPKSELSHKSLNRIGDSYLLEGRYMNALAVFDESSKRDPDSSESQYGIIRLADIGVRNPRLPVQDTIFEVGPYYQPFKTYNQVFKAAKNVEILAEVTLSRGIAFLKEQNYLKAIHEFKKLLPLGKESRFYPQAQKFIRQTLVLLVDRYSRQGGVLPILYSYSDYLSLSLGKVQNLKTVLQIGEAYQTIGMYNEAVKFYERVKKSDSKGIYTDRIFFNLGRIHLDRGNYQEAELVARSFLKNYPRSSQTNDALKLLADSYKLRGQYDKALAEYNNLLILVKENPSEIHYQIAEVYALQKKKPEAIQAYQKTIDVFDRKARIIPRHIPDAYYKLGIALFESGRYPEALKALESASLLFPEHPQKDWANYLQAEAFKKLKDNAQAASQLSNLVKTEEGDDLIKQAAEVELKILDWEKEFKQFL